MRLLEENWGAAATAQRLCPLEETQFAPRGAAAALALRRLKRLPRGVSLASTSLELLIFADFTAQEVEEFDALTFGPPQNSAVEVVKVAGSSCRTAYYDLVVNELTKAKGQAPIAYFADADTAMSSWPNLNAGLRDEESWVRGNFEDCYAWPNQGLDPNGVRASSAF